MTETLSFLSDLEKDKLRVFVQDEVMKEALKKVLLEPILNMGVIKEGESSIERNWVFGIDPKGIMKDEDFGRAVKIRTEAIIMLGQAYNKLSELEPILEEAPKKNPAR